jgi:hypothetical protein
VKFWKSAEELPGLVAINLPKTIKAHPAVGWVRGDQIPSLETLTELNELQKANAELAKEIQTLKAQVGSTSVANLASLDAEIILSGGFSRSNFAQTWEYKASWREIFAYIAPHLLKFPNDDYVQYLLATEFLKRSKEYGRSAKLDTGPFQTMKVQFLALGLITVNYTQTVGGTMGLFWGLSDTGKKTMLEVCSVKAE